MAKPVPPLRDLIGATFAALKRLGGERSVQQLRDRVIDDLQLGADILSIAHGNKGTSELEYRLAWARTYLRNHGLVTKVRYSAWALTRAGEEVEAVDPREVMRAADLRKRLAREARTKDEGSRAP